MMKKRHGYLLTGGKMSAEARRRHWIPWNSSNRMSGALLMWGLGPKPRSCKSGKLLLATRKNVYMRMVL